MSAAKSRARGWNPPRHIRRGFSLVEMLVALTISSLLLTATLSALDASFKSYKVTTESASTQVVLRILMQRLGTLVRTGQQFGPFPVNPILNPIVETKSIEFQVIPDPNSDRREVWSVRRTTVDGPTGPYELRSVVDTYINGSLVASTERTLIRRVLDVNFTLEYDVGPRLRRATIDIAVKADDVQGDTVAGDLEANAIRMVTSVSPRRLD